MLLDHFGTTTDLPTLRGVRIQRLDIFVRRTLSGVFTLAILWIGARSVVGGTLSLGMLLAFLAYREATRH